MNFKEVIDFLNEVILAKDKMGNQHDFTSDRNPLD